MRITEVEPIILRLDQVDPTRADGTQDAFLVRIFTDEGLVGVGEADTSPYVAKTIVEMPASHSTARGLSELLVGADPLAIDHLWTLMWAGSFHYGGAGAALHAISAIDIALWDIAGQAAGVPVSELLGGRRRDAVSVYASEVMPETGGQVRTIAERVVSSGYTAIKLGWGPLGQNLENDVQLVTAAREAIGPERKLMVDGGRAYSVETALDLIAALEPLDIHWLEEPLEPGDYPGYRRLSDATSVRIAAGEADSGIAPYRALVTEGHVNVLQPDLGRCGGFTVARQIAHLAATAGVEVVPHCFSSGVLVAASLQFTSVLDQAAALSEYSVSGSPLVNDLVGVQFQLQSGKLPVPTAPGLGVTLDAKLLESLRYDR
jgi:L-alanine-DL-glutamate epimerase-like enolase superfamily enzyme